MVVLNRIYTRTGDDGSTALGTGERRPKYDLRVAAYGTVDEVNAVIGLARLHAAGHPALDAHAGADPERPFRRRGRSVHARQGQGPGRGAARCHRCPGRMARAADRPAQRGAFAAALVHPAGRQRGRGLSASRPHGLPAGRAPDRRAQGQAGRKRHARRRSNMSIGCRISSSSPPASPTTRAPPTSFGCRAGIAEQIRHGVPALRRQSVQAAGQAARHLVPRSWRMSLVFLVEVGGSDAEAQAIANAFGVTPAALLGGITPAPVLTLLTYMFIHADVGHIFGNMIFLWVFGDDVEEALGRCRFLLFYLLCGVIGALTFVASDPTFDGPLIGASGAISGVVVAYAMLRPCAKVTVLVSIIPLRISAYWVIGALRAHAVVESRSDRQERRRLLVPPRRHAGGRGAVSVDAASRRAVVRMHAAAALSGSVGRPASARARDATCA